LIVFLPDYTHFTTFTIFATSTSRKLPKNFFATRFTEKINLREIQKILKKKVWKSLKKNYFKARRAPERPKKTGRKRGSFAFGRMHKWPNLDQVDLKSLALVLVHLLWIRS
jgi:hypothetical protein